MKQTQHKRTTTAGQIHDPHHGCV